MRERLQFPITKRVAVASAMVANRWWAGKLERQAEKLQMIPPKKEIDYPVGCYL